MTVVALTNSTSPNTVERATADDDPFERSTHLNNLAHNFDEHDHSSAKNLGVLRLQTAAAPASAGQVQVSGDDLRWWGATGGAIKTGVSLDGAQTLTNKTLTAPVVTGGATLAGVLTATAASVEGIAVRSGAAGSYAQVGLGRTAVEATLSVVHSAGTFFANSAVGDLAIRTEGATAVILGVNGATVGLRITSAGDIQWGKALVALGGGGAATLGTCGGTGPGTTAQNSWKRLLDSTGAACWVPVWK